MSLKPVNNLITYDRLAILKKTLKKEKSIASVERFFKQLTDPRRLEWLKAADKLAASKIVDLMGLLLEPAPLYELAQKTYQVLFENRILVGVVLLETVQVKVADRRICHFNKTLLVLANPKFIKKLDEHDVIDLGDSVSLKVFNVLKTTLVTGFFLDILTKLDVNELIQLHKFSRHNRIKNVEIYCSGLIKQSMGRVVHAQELEALLDFWTEHRTTVIPTEEIAKICNLPLGVIEINILKILTFLDLEEHSDISSELKGKIIRKYFHDKKIPYQESESKAHTYNAKGIIISLDNVDHLEGEKPINQLVRDSVVGIYVSPDCFQMT
ncbi:MAG: hypothetical protein ACK5MA_06040, partial [Parachlamydiaceae bacterium]